MIPPEFDYAAPETLDETIRLLHETGDDAKLLAGGHSLLPLMKLRFAAPALLVDLRRVPGLHGVQRENQSWRIGAMVTHSELEHSKELGLVSHAAGLIADRQVRNRGTIGGSLAEGDPAADLPTVLLITEGEVTAQGPNGQRTIAASELHKDYLQTTLEPDEVLTEIRVPALDGFRFGYQKFNRRHEDWATVTVGALVKQTGDICEDVRIGLTNMGPVPVRAGAVEEALRGQPLSSELIAQAAEQAAEGTDPPGELNGSPEYKRHLARVLCGRAVEEAAGLA
jgi:carbon-monoxide dehydrogenase medium subunit